MIRRTPLRTFFPNTLLLLLFASALAACGGGDDGENAEPCQGDDCDECVALNCEELGAQCGTIDNGCGVEIDCGGCGGARACGAEAPNTCSLTCGNGMVDEGEECDDGNRSTEDCEYGEDYYCQVCTFACQIGGGYLQYCGDAKVQDDFGEECDDTDDIDWNGCDSSCKANECQWQEIYKSAPSKANGVAVHGDHLYLANDKSLEVYDITNPAAPTKVATLTDDINLAMRGLQVIDGHLVVPGRSHAITVYSLANPAQPTIVASTPQRAVGADQMVRVGNILYVGGLFYENNSQVRGIIVIDISDISDPVELATAVSPNLYEVYGIAANSSAVYVGGTNGIHYFNVSNPANPSHVGNLDPLPDDFTTTNIKGMRLQGNRLYTNGGSSQLTTFDVSSPLAPTILNTQSSLGGSGGPMLEWESGLYVIGNGLGIFAHKATSQGMQPTSGGFDARLSTFFARKGDVLFAVANNDGVFGSNHYLKALRLTCE